MKLLKNFEMELEMLQPNRPPDSNMVIGGSVALVLHGLEIGRACEDLDVILFMPTAQQLKMVHKYCTPCFTYGSAGEIKEKTRVWHYRKNSADLNIMLANEAFPQGLLSVFLYGTEFKLNSIRNIIDAKLSYSEGVEKKFLRRKDMQHLQDLKNLNFNIESGLSDLPF